ncbi:MAG: hypothetical protein RIM99_09765 [Cyclobacteriaceae bacterium]
MANKKTILSDFHIPSSGSHPKDSIGNMGVFNNGKQVGSVEIKIDGSSTFNTNKGKTL